MDSKPQIQPAIDSETQDKAKRSPYLVCDSCGHYPIQPMHGHYVCPACGLPTKCCEGAPCEL